MLDPTMANYVDILVQQMIKKPEAVLDRLASDQQITEVSNIALSKFIFCNGHALPLPRLSNEERNDIKKDIDSALERLTRWENTPLETVPQLNLRDIKKKHRERKLSQDSTGKSTEVYVTAREGLEEEGASSRSQTRDHISSEVPSLGQGVKPARAPSKIPLCRYSSSPMVSKAYKPLSAAASNGNVTKRSSSQKVKEQANDRNTTAENLVASPTTTTSAELHKYTINPASDSTTDLPKQTSPPKESVSSDLSSSREELELYNSKSIQLDPDSSHGEFELSNSRGLMLEVSSSSIDEGVGRVDHGSGEVLDQSCGQDVEGSRVEVDTALTSSVALRNNTTKTSEKSPPSTQVLRHLEALEAVIELDMTMQSTPGSAAKRRLDLNSPPSSPSEARRPFNLNLSGKSGGRKAPDPASSSPTTSSPSTPRRGISFYVEVDSPHSPRSPRAALARRNTIASPRSSADSPRLVKEVSSPRSNRKSGGLPGRTRSSSALLTSSSRPDSPKLDLVLPSSSGRDVTEEVLTPRRVRNESYNMDTSLVIDARASKITALIRGYLTRALLNSYKVQQHVKTIKDTQEILSGYEVNSDMTAQDKAFYDRLKETLQQTKERLHSIFFDTSVSDQMTLIANTRSARREVQHKEGKLVKPGSARKRMAKKTVRQKAWI
ncbi:hypothetical protein ACHWQZ_G006365 [Mnemiopsis leidyi]